MYQKLEDIFSPYKYLDLHWKYFKDGFQLIKRLKALNVCMEENCFKLNVKSKNWYIQAR